MFSNDTAVAGLRCGCSIVCNFGRPDVYSFGMSFNGLMLFHTRIF